MAAGYRPCRRCKPTEDPLSLRHALAIRRACARSARSSPPRGSSAWSNSSWLIASERETQTRLHWRCRLRRGATAEPRLPLHQVSARLTILTAVALVTLLLKKTKIGLAFRSWVVTLACAPVSTAQQAGELDYAPAFQLGHPKAFELANRLVDILVNGSLASYSRIIHKALVHRPPVIGLGTAGVVAAVLILRVLAIRA